MRLFVCSLILLICSHTALAGQGTLSDNIRIESERLGYALQYRVYTPPGYENLSNLPTIYVTDGQWYISQAEFNRVLDREITKGKVKPVVAVFVDNRNPDDLRENRRNNQFFCVIEYADFFRKELVPTISQNYKVSDDRTDRAILGVSFGGLNSGCFGIMAYDVFEGIAMQSPAMHPVPSLHDAYANEARRPIRIFLSAGDENDITRRTINLKNALNRKGYPLKYKKNQKGHDWSNWRPLMDDVLRFFFPAELTE